MSYGLHTQPTFICSVPVRARLTHLMEDADDSLWNPKIPPMQMTCLVMFFQSANSVIRLWVYIAHFLCGSFFLLENNKNTQITSTQTDPCLSLCHSKTIKGNDYKKVMLEPLTHLEHGDSLCLLPSPCWNVMLKETTTVSGYAHKYGEEQRSVRQEPDSGQGNSTLKGID